MRTGTLQRMGGHCLEGARVEILRQSPATRNLTVRLITDHIGVYKKGVELVVAPWELEEDGVS